MSERPKRQPLGDVLDVASGQVDPTVEPYADMPHIGGENIESETGRIINVATASQIGLTSGKYLFSEADVLYSKIRPNLNKVAVPAFVGICSADIYPLRPKPGRLSREFLAHLLRSQDFLTFTQKHSSRTNIPKVNRECLLGYEAVLPPLAEQRRIAEVLDRAEALRGKRRAALAQLDSLTQSLFLDLFGDPKSNPKKWPCVPFAELGENQDSQRVPVKSSDRDVRKGKYPYYGASGIIDWVDDFIYEGDRLLIGEDGANLVARSTPVAYIARGQYWVNNHAHVIADNGRADLRFLEFFIEQLDLKPFVSGTAQPKLNRSNLDRISVPLPPISLQCEFARRATAVEALKTAQRASLAELDALFATLQHRAFKGEL